MLLGRAFFILACLMFIAVAGYVRFGWMGLAFASAVYLLMPWREA